jgi:hypothetical protein
LRLRARWRRASHAEVGFRSAWRPSPFARQKTHEPPCFLTERSFFRGTLAGCRRSRPELCPPPVTPRSPAPKKKGEAGLPQHNRLSSTPSSESRKGAFLQVLGIPAPARAKRARQGKAPSRHAGCACDRRFVVGRQLRPAHCLRRRGEPRAPSSPRSARRAEHERSSGSRPWRGALPRPSPFSRRARAPTVRVIRAARTHAAGMILPHLMRVFHIRPASQTATSVARVSNLQPEGLATALESPGGVAARLAYAVSGAWSPLRFGNSYCQPSREAARVDQEAGGLGQAGWPQPCLPSSPASGLLVSLPSRGAFGFLLGICPPPERTGRARRGNRLQVTAPVYGPRRLFIDGRPPPRPWRCEPGLMLALEPLAVGLEAIGLGLKELALLPDLGALRGRSASSAATGAA